MIICEFINLYYERLLSKFKNQNHINVLQVTQFIYLCVLVTIIINDKA